MGKNKEHFSKLNNIDLSPKEIYNIKDKINKMSNTDKTTFIYNLLNSNNNNNELFNIISQQTKKFDQSNFITHTNDNLIILSKKKKNIIKNYN